MKNVILLAAMALMIAGCSNGGSNSSKSSVTECSAEFKDSALRLQLQGEQLTAILPALKKNGKATPAGYRAIRNYTNACLKHIQKFGTSQCLYTDMKGDKKIYPKEADGWVKSKETCEMFDTQLRKIGY